MYSLLEAVFNLEAQPIEANDLDGVQRDVCAHQQARTSGRVNDGDKAYEPTAGTPQQIADPILDRDVVLAIDWARSRLHGLGIAEQMFELDPVAVKPWTTSFARAEWHVWGKGDRVGLHPGDQVVVLIV